MSFSKTIFIFSITFVIIMTPSSKIVLRDLIAVVEINMISRSPIQLVDVIILSQMLVRTN